MDTRKELEHELEQIGKWEKEQKSLFIWDKIGRLPFVMLDRIMPKMVRDKLAELMNEVGQYVQQGGKFLVQKRTIAMKLQTCAERSGYELTPNEIEADGAGMYTVDGLPLSVLDQAADEITESRTRLAAVQGATTGVGGIVTLAADIPLVIGLSLKVLQEIALCYGYDPDDPLERIFIVKCLQFASADIVGKRAILEELALYDDESKQVQLVSQMQGWREVFNTYAESFGWKKLFQLIPVAGMLFGSISNRSTISNVAETGKMLYKKRLIQQRLLRL